MPSDNNSRDINTNIWDTYTQLGSQAWKSGEVKIAYKMFHAAFKEAKKEEFKKMRLAASLCNLALIYNKQLRYRKAYAFLDRALNLLEESGGKDNAHLPNVLDRLADVSIALSNESAAIKYLERAHKIESKYIDSSNKQIVDRVKKIALLHLKEGRKEEVDVQLQQIYINVQP